MNKKDLILFEKEIADLFNKGKIRSPIHLYKDNEDKKDNEIINKMLEYFKERFENGRE